MEERNVDSTTYYNPHMYRLDKFDSRVPGPGEQFSRKKNKDQCRYYLRVRSF